MSRNSSINSKKKFLAVTPFFIAKGPYWRRDFTIIQLIPSAKLYVSRNLVSKKTKKKLKKNKEKFKFKKILILIFYFHHS